MKKTREEILDENIEILLKEFKKADVNFNGNIFKFLNSEEFEEFEEFANVFMNIVSVSSFGDSKYCVNIILNYIGMLYERYISIEEFKSYILYMPKEILEELTNLHKREEEEEAAKLKKLKL